MGWRNLTLALSTGWRGRNSKIDWEIEAKEPHPNPSPRERELEELLEDWSEKTSPLPSPLSREEETRRTVRRLNQG
jgi:hypothetical protein